MFQAMSETAIVLRRITSEAEAALSDELFREYGAWSVERLATECGVTFPDDRLEQVHAAFREEWPHLFSAGGRFYLALIGEEPAGVGTLKPVSGTVAELKRMFTRPGCRGRGVARCLLQQMIEDAQEIGYSTLRLETLSYMREAHNLYRAMGFVEVEPFEAEGTTAGLAEHELFMQLTLTRS
jgi:GNAT superfamily N-acetyltransferase